MKLLDNFFDFLKNFYRYQDNSNPKPDNWVNIHVWQSTTVKGSHKGAIKIIKEPIKGKDIGNVGHVSIETANIYASLWPAEPKELKEPVMGTNSPSLKTDMNKDHENKKPDISLTLYSLNKPMLEKKHKERINHMDWKITGDTGRSGQNVHSCASYAYSLLKAGGINELSYKCANLNQFFKSPMPIEPNDIAECIKAAKKNELKRYPQTSEFSDRNNLTR